MTPEMHLIFAALML